MEISVFIQLAIECLMIASLIVGIIGILYFIYYLYNKRKNKYKKTDLKQLIVNALLLGYIIVVLIATLGGRTAQYGKISLELFSSYRFAINYFDMNAWRNLILNICMFIPLGILLPFLHRCFKKCYVTYGCGFLFTLFIEFFQFILKRGIFELDDLFNNTLGCMIGFGFYALGYYVIHKVKKEHPDIKKLILKLFPLLLTVISFTVIFVNYYTKDLGNIRQAYYQTIDTSKINIVNTADLSDEHQTDYVYQVKKYDEDECYQIAQIYFQNHQEQIEDNYTETSNSTMLFYSQDRNMIVTVDYNGGVTYMYLDDYSYQLNEGLSFNEVKEVLSQYDINIDSSAHFNNLGEGYYEIIVDQLSDDGFTKGTLNCQISEDKELVKLENNIVFYKQYKKYSLISTNEAFQQIKKGHFNIDYLENIEDEIVINKVRLNYIQDSKGYYQPVYEFLTNGNGIIYVPAI